MLFRHIYGVVCEEIRLETQLAVVGVNHRTSRVAVRERFWSSESRLYEALHRLANAEGIEEIVLLVTRNRTEFILWPRDSTAATKSIRDYLARESRLLSDSEERALEEFTSRTIERITGLLGRELRETPEIPEQDRLTSVVRRLFHLPQPSAALQTRN